MTLDYVCFFAALLCLWLPATWFAPRSLRQRLLAPARRRRDGLKSLFRSKLNWFDAVRAAAGTWVLFNAVEFLQPGPDAEELGHILLGAKFAVLLLGTAVQTLRFEEETRVIGPLFYLAGLACVLAGPSAGLPAVVFGVNCALLLRRLRLAFFFTPLALAACGVLFGAPVAGGLGALLFMLPGFLAFAFDQTPRYVRHPGRAAPRRLLAWPGGVRPESLAPLAENPAVVAAPFRESRAA